MIHHFRGFWAARRSFLIRGLVDRAYWSRADGCMVTPMKCSKCGGMYDEELQEARLKVIRGDDFRCLSCDDKGGKIRDIRAVQFTFEVV